VYRYSTQSRTRCRYVEMFRRNRIAQEHRQRIVQAFENEDEDYLLVADTLGVNRSTARGIVARFIKEGRIHELPRCSRNNIRVDEEMRDCLEQIINDNCVLTLVQINRELRRRLPHKPEIHESTVARTLNGMLFTLKRGCPQKSNIRRPRLKNRFCSNFAQIYLIISENAPDIFLGQMLF
jgi:transposase